MRMFYFREPKDYRFARATPSGTFSGIGRCPECGVSRREVVPPLILRWLRGSDLVGDFTLAGIHDALVVTQRVRDVLEKEFCGFEFGSVEMYQEPKLRRPQRPTGRIERMVGLRHGECPLWHLVPTSWCGLDLQRSGVVLIKTCSVCGKRFYGSSVPDRRRLVLDPSTWQGEGIFRIPEYPRLLYCTERVKDRIESHGFTNVAFQLDGEIPEREARPRTCATPLEQAAGPAKELGGTAGFTNVSHHYTAREPDSGGDTVDGHGPSAIDSEAGMASPAGFPSYNEMPEDNEELAKVQVSFPYLPDNSAESCPVSIEEVVDYLALEVPGGESLTSHDLQFVRTAQVGERLFWIWRFVDPEGDEWYVAVSKGPDGGASMTGDENSYQLSPEQFMLGVYHQVF